MKPRFRTFALFLCTLAGCGGGETSLEVTVTFDDAAHHPERLSVSVSIAGMVRKSDATLLVNARPVRSGDSFYVILPDVVDGDTSEVDVAAIEGGIETLKGNGIARIKLGATVALSVVLSGSSSMADGGAGDLPLPGDGGVVADLARASDGAALPDLATLPDLAVSGDFAGVNTGPSSDVAEDVVNTWTVGESVNDAIAPCNPQQRGNVSVVGDVNHKMVGAQAAQGINNGNNFFGLAYPKGMNAGWDLSSRTGVEFYVDGQMPVSYVSWTPAAPTVVLCGPNGAYRQLQPMNNILPRNGNGYVKVDLPLVGDGNFIVTDVKGFSLTQVNSIEFHADPMRENGILGPTSLWIDGLKFY
jgi:hypothetical protein